MRPPRKFPPAVAARMSEVRDRLDARWRVLIDAAAPELAATTSPAAVEQILQRMVADLVDLLDREEARILDELLRHQPQLLKH